MVTAEFFDKNLEGTHCFHMEVKVAVLDAISQFYGLLRKPQLYEKSYVPILQSVTLYQFPNLKFKSWMESTVACSCIAKVGRAPLIDLQKCFLKCFIDWYCSENSNFIPEWLYLAEKVSKGAKKWQKKPQIWFRMHFPNFFFMANLKYRESSVSTVSISTDF